MDSLIHVVSKSDNSQHATFPLTTPPPPLAPSSIRLRTTLITLSSNNLTYARLGDALRWWDAYPVPASAPAPYTTWGIVPAWGYATVLSSTIPALPADTTLWGFWPTSSHAFDLQLRGAAPAGHWIETSPHRRALMHLYNRYVAAPIPAALPAAAATVALKPVWECGYLAARHVFAARARTPVHPLGAGLPWTPDDADLSAAVVVSLSASSDVGAGGAEELWRRDVAIESESPEEYFKNMNASWEKCLEESGMGEFETVPEKGIEGVEGVWQDLCEQKVKPNQAIVVRV
ncbi:hypothetical protein UCRNP2_5958 [Neofusicoccum parvum UCRNP2]|uniref:Uncharacterized protein n=1 Tax=Botryosphaeria parva (strain UCR-NP2) TaxID=1287680 RepID=R1GG77_BOTPV|nr:hypothetical protein UCRNP2_5958 [Neofusicoccum parvum UCRNP2]